MCAKLDLKQIHIASYDTSPPCNLHILYKAVLNNRYMDNNEWKVIAVCEICIFSNRLQ